jgi:hypothetical protein
VSAIVATLAFAPKGLKDSAQGFDPGLNVSMSRALKVAPDGIVSGDVCVVIGRAVIPRLMPLQGISGTTLNPGLKPWVLKPLRGRNRMEQSRNGSFV